MNYRYNLLGSETAHTVTMPGGEVELTLRRVSPAYPWRHELLPRPIMALRDAKRSLKAAWLKRQIRRMRPHARRMQIDC